MATRTLHCPTCGGMQVFRLLDAEERAAVREEKKDPRYYVDNLWRCTAKGCLTYYPHLRKRDRGLLPERFRAEETAAEA